MLEKHEQDQEAEQQGQELNQPTTIDENSIEPPTIDESAPTVVELMSPQPIIVRRDDDGAEHFSPQNLETRPLIPHDAKALETQPLHTALPNVTVTDLAGAIVQRPGEAPPPKNEQQPLGRVKKLRQASSEMIDQAAYDPSMRFLLVAAVLFVIFLLLMILSRVVG